MKGTVQGRFDTLSRCVPNIAAHGEANQKNVARAWSW
jgi:hypothetical protein